MNIKNKNLFLLLILISVGYCIAEDFFVTQPPITKKRSVSKVKQDMVEILADVLDLECKLIESKAKIQQEILKRITEIADNNKSNKIYLAKSEELQAGLDKLILLKKDLIQNLEKSSDALNFIRSGCIVTKAKNN